jgi:MOSC domain-containing protein YiiM
VKVISVNAGRIRPAAYGPQGRTAIDKRPVDGPVRVNELGMEIDEQGDTRHHGGIDQAVYAVAREELDWWSQQLGRTLRDGMFGENLTTQDVNVDEAVIGERWSIGSVLLEVSAPRIPCATFQGFLGEPRWVKRFTEHARTGAYLRVLQPGMLRAGDEVHVVHRPYHGVTVHETFLVLTGDRMLAPRLLEAPELPAEAHETARRLLRAT